VRVKKKARSDTLGLGVLLGYCVRLGAMHTTLFNDAEPPSLRLPLRVTSYERLVQHWPHLYGGLAAEAGRRVDRERAETLFPTDDHRLADIRPVLGRLRLQNAFVEHTSAPS
jgi:hypothetical protein